MCGAGRFLAISLASLVVVARGHYPIGLDFQGGAMLAVRALCLFHRPPPARETA